MSTRPMTQEQLDAIQGRVDCGTPTTEDVSNLLAEVERLRARLTVDDAMVKRGAFALARRRAEDPLARDRVVGHTLLVDAKAVLNAALGTEEGA